MFPAVCFGQFWQPLVWGALNTPLEQASLRIFMQCIDDGVWSEKANSDYLLPKQDLGRIVAEPASDFLHKNGAKIHLETRVSHLNHHIDGRIEINGEVFDAVILAVAPYHVDALCLKIRLTIFRRLSIVALSCDYHGLFALCPSSQTAGAFNRVF